LAATPFLLQVLVFFPTARTTQVFAEAVNAAGEWRLWTKVVRVARMASGLDLEIVNNHSEVVTRY
jgi:hypothetical protein